MIMLPDGAVIFASLSGNYQDDKNSPAARVARFPRLPWIIYVSIACAGRRGTHSRDCPIRRRVWKSHSKANPYTQP